MVNAIEPVLTDCHGFMLKPGSTVTKIADDTRFVVSTVRQFRRSPVVLSLDDGNGGSVDTSLVMIDDDEQDEHALFCKRCSNHFKAKFEYERGCGRCNAD